MQVKHGPLHCRKHENNFVEQKILRYGCFYQKASSLVDTACIISPPSPFSFCFVDLAVIGDDGLKKTHSSVKLPAPGL